MKGEKVKVAERTDEVSVEKEGCGMCCGQFGGVTEGCRGETERRPLHLHISVES